jgi:outer membrane protein
MRPKSPFFIGECGSLMLYYPGSGWRFNISSGGGLALLRSVRWGALLFLLWPALVLPQEVLTLDQAVAFALQHNRQIKVAQLEVGKSENAVTVMRKYRLPQLNYYMLEGHLLDPINFNFPAGLFGTFPQLGPIPPGPTTLNTPARFFTLVFAQINQPLSQQYRIGLGIQNEKLKQQIAQEELSREEQTIVNDVKKTYYNLAQTQSGLRATEETVKLFQELNRVASNGLTEQVVLKSDVLDTQTGLANTETQALTLRDTAATLKEKMNTLLGRDLKTEFAIGTAPETLGPELDLAALRDRALQQRPELREARLKIQQAEVDRKVKKSEYIPDVSAHLDYLSLFDVHFIPSNIAAIGVEVKYEIFDWGRKKVELAQKSKTIEQAKTAVEEATAQIEVEVGLDYRKLEEARQQLRVANLALETDQEKVRVAVNRYDQNQVLLKDVLQLRASLAEKTYKYQEVLLSFWTARTDLEKATGER